MKKSTIWVRTISTPAGAVILGALEDSLCLCDWVAEKRRARMDRRIERELTATMRRGESLVLDRAEGELREYFAGKRRTFDIPLLFAGTPFQKSVWNLLLQIPYGQTMSYGEMATRLGRPTAVRAVANANGANAISLFAPCHRVIGHDGSLTGFGGGLAAKRFLLTLEGALFRS